MQVAAQCDTSTNVPFNERDALWPNYSPPQDLIFTHGSGTELYTDRGETYIDFLSGIAVTAFGHAHPHLLDALSTQSKKLWHVSNVFRIPEAEKLAKRLAAVSFADRIFFANSGTEAIEASIKAVRGYQAAIGKPERNRIIGMSDSFHGRTIAAVAASGNPSYVQNFAPTDHGFDHITWGDMASLDAVINEKTAGVIVETVQGEGGIRPLTSQMLNHLRQVCDARGLLLILDEVQCGVGRSGKLFAYETFGIEPDILAAAKGLGGGFPIGACLVSEKVGQHMVVGTHGSTFGGNPLAAAVGNAVLDLVLEPGLLENVLKQANTLRAGLEELVSDCPSVLSKVTGLGLMIGAKCAIPNVELMTALRQSKLLVGRAGDNMIRLLPPLNVSDMHVTQALNILGKEVRRLEQP
ncbi:MAG: acetylornithine transaminase [Gammaproteobacteria bacterium]|nr:acetylornithine transaminase [Gammaproteobacteria bacterium]